MRYDAIVVGGGPAGSTCARLLGRAGWSVVVIDRAAFPRDKVCAGWLTPEVFPLLDLTVAEYAVQDRTLQEIRAFRTGVFGRGTIETRYDAVVSYGIRRCEFDTYLLRRATVPVVENTPVRSLRRHGATWVINHEFEAPLVIGAGGHFCPVAQHLANGREPQPVIAREAEFPVDDGEDAESHAAPELFFCRDFEGYAWRVRKGNYLNVGIGRRDLQDFAAHTRAFVSFLEARGDISPGASIAWRGHAYLAYGSGPRPLTGPGMLLLGDAAGLAYPESGEGIRPAIESGRLAGEMLIAGSGPADERPLHGYAREISRRYPAAGRPPRGLRSTVAALGRVLLGSRTFTRHVLLNRWFLRHHLFGAPRTQL
jgi:geranylgeranyl reductase family protein